MMETGMAMAEMIVVLKIGQEEEDDDRGEQAAEQQVMLERADRGLDEGRLVHRPRRRARRPAASA